MQNIDDSDEPGARKMKTMQPTKAMSKISNTRYLNQNVYAMFLQKRYQQCLKLIARSPNDQFKLYVKALIEKEQFKLESSLSLLSECQTMNKLNFTYLKAIAKNFYLLGKYKSSLEVAKDAYKLNSGESEIFYIMGKISLALNDVENAVTHFNHSISKEPNEQSYIQLSKVHLSQQRYSQAAQTVKQALKYLAAHVHLRSAIQIKKDPFLYNLLGVCLSQLKDFSNAERAFDEALSSGHNEQIKYNYLTCLLKSGKKDKAKKVVDELSTIAVSPSIREKLIKAKTLL